MSPCRVGTPPDRRRSGGAGSERRLHHPAMAERVDDRGAPVAVVLVDLAGQLRAGRHRGGDGGVDVRHPQDEADRGGPGHRSDVADLGVLVGHVEKTGAELELDVADPVVGHHDRLVDHAGPEHLDVPVDRLPGIADGEVGDGRSGREIGRSGGGAVGGAVVVDMDAPLELDAGSPSAISRRARSWLAKPGSGVTGRIGSRRASKGSVISVLFAVDAAEGGLGPPEQRLGGVDAALQQRGDLGHGQVVDVAQRRARPGAGGRAGPGSHGPATASMRTSQGSTASGPWSATAASLRSSRPWRRQWSTSL